MPVSLGPTGLLELSGPDAFAFARGQFTSDVRLAPGCWQWSAWLDPQGRVRNVGALFAAAEDRLLMWLPLGDAAAMAAALLPFRFRSRLEIKPVEAALLATAPGRNLPAAGTFAADDSGWRFGLAGGRGAWLRPGPASDADPAALDTWRRADIAACLPLLDSAVSGRFVPQALGLERLDAIRFDKGCFPGQEVAARLHFRGGNKRHLMALAGPGAAPGPGTPVTTADDASAGTVLYAAAAGEQRFECLAVIHDDADTACLQHAGGGPLTPLAPPGGDCA